MKTKDSQESFEEFKNSFFYGSRADLNFKFLAHLSTEDAGRFFQSLLDKLGDTVNDQNLDRVIDHIYTWQLAGYRHEKTIPYDTGPFTPLPKPLDESRLALLTSSGHFVKGDDPQPLGVSDMSQEEAMSRIFEFLKTEPQLSKIPVDTPREQLQVRHGGYDIRTPMIDPNVNLPLDRLRELAAQGLIGELAPEAYSFVGACAQQRLLKRTGPKWVERMQAKNIDVVLLVPV
jgi:D-proline reductase (dithiol) PrdB